MIKHELWSMSPRCGSALSSAKMEAQISLLRFLQFAHRFFEPLKRSLIIFRCIIVRSALPEFPPCSLFAFHRPIGFFSYPWMFGVGLVIQANPNNYHSPIKSRVGSGRAPRPARTNAIFSQDKITSCTPGKNAATSSTVLAASHPPLVVTRKSHHYLSNISVSN